MKDFSIVIPTVNEVDNIILLLQQIYNATQPFGMKPEILVVDDGSTDGTRERVRSYRGNLDVRLICRDSVRGLASAVIVGAREAVHNYIVVMDADLSHPPEMLPRLIGPLLDGTYDMVIGSRYIKEGSTPDWPAVRRLGSQFASLPAQLLTSVRDPLSGFFSVNRQYFMNLDQNLAGFKIGLEIIARSKDSLRVLEVPISFKDRSHGSSKMNFHILKEYLYQLCRLSIMGFQG